MPQLYLAIPLLPLIAAIIVGLFGSKLPRAASHWLTILGVGLSFAMSVCVLQDSMQGHVYNHTVYQSKNPLQS